MRLQNWRKSLQTFGEKCLMYIFVKAPCCGVDPLRSHHYRTVKRIRKIEQKIYKYNSSNVIWWNASENLSWVDNLSFRKRICFRLSVVKHINSPRWDFWRCSGTTDAIIVGTKKRRLEDGRREGLQPILETGSQKNYWFCLIIYLIHILHLLVEYWRSPLE